MQEATAKNFTCNICGNDNEAPKEPIGREGSGCGHCGSTTRVRGLIALLAKELFGFPLTLPEFPIMKGIRGVGMSDPPELARRLAEKFDYTNTFYHKAPKLDVSHLEPSDEGRFDFILSADIMEHVPQPLETAFSNLHRLLKPNGVLLMTVPYGLEENTKEHFPDLHEFVLVSPGGTSVLLNRRKDKTIEVFENLIFHGGPGSVLELRVFSEKALRSLLQTCGFRSVFFASEDVAEFCVFHTEKWSLPIACRNGNFVPPKEEFASEYRRALRETASERHRLRGVIAAMESSKFWKLRDYWFKVKSLIPASGK